ncbi:MAG TPA: phospholipase D-like domain-containing protein [Streptosporangiaceae bacterium]|jgi:phosphatidylserine/phosphatidylglycerophosphate/cardiolipin synthase-like enzyme
MLRRTLLASALAMGTSLATVAAIGMAAAPAASAATTYTLFTEPSAGFSTVYNLINGAASSIDMTMYQLEDTTAEQDLATAAGRGVDVRVILDEKEQSDNQAAYTYLTDNGVHVVWSSSSYYYTHQKSLVIDNSTAVIMTANLTSQYYSTSRDYGVVDTDAKDVAAVVAVFNADYAHTSITPSDGDDLVWSPTDSQTHLLALINGATSSLMIESEEMDDTTITNALVSAAERGVKVEVCGENEDGEYDSEYETLVDAGATVHYYSSSTGFYIHGKMILANYGASGAKIFIGSENFSNTSLNENRELGLIISTAAILSPVDSTFASDFAGGKNWTK